MKFICSSSLVKKEIDKAVNFTSGAMHVSIYSTVLLESYNNNLTIKTTNGKKGFTSTLTVQTDIPGSVVVYCDKLGAILKTMPDSDVVFETIGNNLSITPVNSRKVKVNMRTLEADRFPVLETIDNNKMFSLSQRLFLDMIDKVSYAVGNDESKFFLTGVYMEKKDNKLIMVATDSKRLAVVKRVFEQEIPEFDSGIIPVDFLTNIRKIATGEGLFSIAMTDKYIFAHISNTTIYCSLIAGKYPLYERVIPPQLDYSVIVNTKDLSDALNSVSIMADEKSKKIHVTMKDNTMFIMSESDTLGDMTQELPCEYESNETTISFNVKLLENAVKRITSDNCCIAFNSPKTAVVIKPYPEQDYMAVVMPVYNGEEKNG